MTNKGTMYEEIFLGLYRSVDRMMQAYNRQDLNRNRTNYGSATAFASVLQSMGHEVDLKVYGDGDYLLTNAFVVDGRQFDFFHK